MSRVPLLLLALCLSLYPCALRAQTTNGSITGRVTDPSKATIADAKVAAVNTGTNFRYETATNGAGEYTLANLPPGTYRIEVEHPIFRKAVIENIALQVVQTQNLDIGLQLGSVNESIVVQADGGLLEASDASLSQVIDEKRVLGFPLNSRNVMQLVALSPGVINGGRASATQRQAGYGTAFSVGGQRDNTSVVLIDGMEISGQELDNYPVQAPSPADVCG
jgi:Carboxypeptidase regulatory-like domain